MYPEAPPAYGTRNRAAGGRRREDEGEGQGGGDRRARAAPQTCEAPGGHARVREQRDSAVSWGPPGDGGGPSGGALGAIGTATSGTHTRYNNCMFLGINNGLLNSEEHRVGPALTRGKLNLYNNYWENEWQNVYVWSTWNNLMGDPATPMWTAFPSELTAAHADVATALGGVRVVYLGTHRNATAEAADLEPRIATACSRSDARRRKKRW